MATDLGLLQKLSQFQPSNCHHQISTQSHLSNLNSGGPPWMWNPSHQAQSQKQHQDQDDESWEVRAFAEDTGNIMGTTWPPRSYTCTFCRREFRSAQALGGHMNVHRRDRARLHQTAPSSSALIIPTQELMAAAAAASGGGGGLCLLYQLPNNHNGSIYTGAQTNANACNNLDSRVPSPSTLLSISPYPSNNHLLSPAGAAPQGLNQHHHHHLQYYNKLGDPTSLSADYSNCNKESSSSADNMEELDLELRL